MADQFDGKLIANRYEVLKTLGQGGMGVVLLCLDTTLSRKVAVKVLSKNSDDEAVQRFQIEARAAAKLKHDNILQVMDFGETDGRLFLVMDYLDGITLSSLIKREAYLEPEVAIPIFIQICDGIAHAHRRDVLHRDLKPSNIMLVPGADSTWTAKLVDFGIAKLKTISDQKLTTTGLVVGSPLYLSPEAGLGQPCDNRSDLYSLGCLFYETLTGTPPFYGDTAFATIMMHANDLAPTMSESTNRHYDEGLEELVAKCLEKDPLDRYQTAEQLREDLSRINSALNSKNNTQTPVEIQERRSELKHSPPLSKVQILFFVLVLVAISYWGFKLATDTSRIPQFTKESDATDLELIQAAKKTARKPGSKNEHYEWSKKKVDGLKTADDENLVLFAREHPQITAWNLQQTLIKGPGLSALPQTTSSLELKRTAIGKIAIENISKLENLSFLDIRECESLQPEDLEPLSRLEKLQTIQVSLPETKADADEFIEELSKIPNLTAISLKGYITTDSIVKLKALSKIQLLDFHLPDNDYDPVTLAKALDDLPSMTQIHMSDHSLDAKTVMALSKHNKLTQLHVVLPYLDLGRSRKRAEELVQAISHLEHLTYLSIIGELDSGMISAIKTMPALKQLKYSRNQPPEVLKDIKKLTPRVQLMADK